MLYPKEDKENRILLYAVSAGSPLASEFAPSLRAPCGLPAGSLHFRLLTTPQHTLSPILSIPSLDHPILPSRLVADLICL